MRLSDAIFKFLGGEGDPARVQYTVVDGRGGYFQNVRRLAEFSAERIVLLGRRGGLCIEGEGLTLGKYTAGDVAVFGEIRGVFRTEAP